MDKIQTGQNKLSLFHIKRSRLATGLSPKSGQKYLDFRKLFENRMSQNQTVLGYLKAGLLQIPDIYFLSCFGQAIESPSTALTPSPAFNSLTDSRPFFNDGSASVVQSKSGWKFVLFCRTFIPQGLSCLKKVMIILLSFRIF